MSNKKTSKAKLIVTIIKRPMTKKLIQAIKQAGAAGSTILYGEGIKRKKKQIPGNTHYTERDVILTVVSEELSGECYKPFM